MVLSTEKPSKQVNRVARRLTCGTK